MVRATEGSSFPRGTPRCTGTHIYTSQVIDSLPCPQAGTPTQPPLGQTSRPVYGAASWATGDPLREAGESCGGWYWALGVN